MLLRRLLKYLCVFLILTPAYAQSLPQGMRVSWAANPPEEGVEWYYVEWFNGDTQEWIRPPNSATSRLNIVLAFQEAGVSPRDGLEICVRVTAAKGGEPPSPPSDPACATMGTQPTPDTPTTSSTLSAPTGVGVTFTF